MVSPFSKGMAYSGNEERFMRAEVRERNGGTLGPRWGKAGTPRCLDSACTPRGTQLRRWAGKYWAVLLKTTSPAAVWHMAWSGESRGKSPDAKGQQDCNKSCCSHQWRLGCWKSFHSPNKWQRTQWKGLKSKKQYEVLTSLPTSFPRADTYAQQRLKCTHPPVHWTSNCYKTPGWQEFRCKMNHTNTLVFRRELATWSDSANQEKCKCQIQMGNRHKQKSLKGTQTTKMRWHLFAGTLVHFTRWTDISLFQKKQLGS